MEASFRSGVNSISFKSSCYQTREWRGLKAHVNPRTGNNLTVFNANPRKELDRPCLDWGRSDGKSSICATDRSFGWGSQPLPSTGLSMFPRAFDGLSKERVPPGSRLNSF